MKPILFNIFGINVYGYGTMIAIGIVFAILLVNYRSKNTCYDEDSIWNMLMIAIISGIVGGKTLFVITEIRNIFKNPMILKDIGSGFVIYGAIIGGIVGIYFYSKSKKWNVFETLDLIAPSVPLAQGFGRIGCLLAGCCYGKETSLPIGVEFINSPFAPSGVIRHPTQIYSSIFDFIITFILLWYDKKSNKKGRVFGLYLILYSVGRFFVEFLRGDPRGNVNFLSTSQFISIFVLVAGIIICKRK
ncbi:prolipoprotein diacylglyceryl transferase [Clostridium acetireducens DSM 10703]|jgi:phosphatidylglycerol:prolipoprotein diacylglycerol transferase|uniref:Phosphatidylglycerol--prolipoprotein diacylglyceryl transferase n=1 Tax=Clostridium acetireducens DSM 10703 TaxID=1121290 RepID=A0A1E8EXI7_9CLOT|nr:prolipoprotein diacylglyceryl transferase [Clostridium acetireducens]OFI05487.1 prolipoprotein diacylglyceryl transferase [Clostridium acetireducens DSM 10703]